MKLIMRTEYDDLRLNPLHRIASDTNGDKQIVKIFHGDLLIAKRVKQKKSLRYFGIKGYQDYLTEQHG